MTDHDGMTATGWRAHSLAADGSDSAESWTTDPAAQLLWERLVRARSESQFVSMSEDAVFRFYLPFARSLVRCSAASELDRDRAVQAAELGLARAVLAWRQYDCAAFVAFARGVILHQIQAPPAGSTLRRRRNSALPTRHRMAN